MDFKTGPHIPIGHMARNSRSIGQMFYQQVARIPERPAFFHKSNAQWIPVSWQQWYEHSASIAGKLCELGLVAGDCIAILGPTQPNWAYCDMAGQLAGLVPVGLYPMQTAEQLQYLISHSEAKVVFVQGAAEIAHILEAVKDNEAVKAVVVWDPEEYESYKDQDTRVMPLTSFLDAAAITTAERDKRLAEREWDNTAMFIYTSGTTGHPKGAMISHANLLQLLSATEGLQDMYEDDISLSFLPMAHAAERNLAYYGRVSTGMATCYASSTGAVLEELQEVQPTMFGSVPRIFEKAYDKVMSELDKLPDGVRRLIEWCIEVGRQKVRLEMDGKKVPLTLQIKFRVADAVFFKKVREKFGGRVKQFITGAAPLAREIMEFFWAAGMPIYEAYGMTEATVCTHLNIPGSARIGTVGRPIGEIEQRIAEDGEILVRGPWVFQGYYKNPEATAETIVDGWLHTGDIGQIDADGYLKITDRKKHLIITAGGKNLAPANIENAIKNESPLISQVHAHGDKRKFVSALIAPSPVDTLEWGVQKQFLPESDAQVLIKELMENPAARSAALNEAMARVVQHNEFSELIRDAVQRGNDKLANVEKVKKFFILDRDFSQEQGELTPTMKVKRKVLEEKFESQFNQLYDSDTFGNSV